MKKIGFGTRPSEIKGLDKDISFEETPYDDVADGSAQTGYHPKSSRREQNSRSGNFLKIFLAVSIVLILSIFFVFGFSWDVVLDRAVFMSGQKEFQVENRGSVHVGFKEGLVLKEFMFKGFYRLFPPDNVSVEIVGIRKLEGVSGIDILALLKPEEKTSYEMVLKKDGRQLGQVFIELDMDADGWIKRADIVEDKKVKKECYKRAVKLSPDSEQAHIALGRLYESEKKTRKAVVEYEAAAKVNPGNIQVLKKLLLLYSRVNKKKDIINVYKRLALADKTHADDYFFKAGMMAEKKGSYDQAMSFFRKTLSSNRAHVEAREKLVKIYAKNKQWNRAVGNIKVLMEYDPRNPELYLYLSDLYLQTNNLKGAVDAGRRAVELKKNDPSIYLQLAMIYEKAKQQEKALECYRQVVKLDRKNAAAYNNLGVLLENSGDRKKAIGSYIKAVKYKPSDITYRMNLADAYEKDKQWKNAVRQYEKAVKLDKKNRDAWEALAVLYYKQIKNKWKSVEAYKKLCSLDPGKILWHKQVAVLYEQLGKIDKARNEYKKILKINPRNKDAKQKYLALSKQKVKRQIK